MERWYHRFLYSINHDSSEVNNVQKIDWIVRTSTHIFLFGMDSSFFQRSISFSYLSEKNGEKN